MLPAIVVEYLWAFEKNGFKAYIVGGAVRDMLRGRTPNDYDVTTNAKVEDIKKIFKDHSICDTGIKHGSVSVNFDGMIFETTTFRIDGDYKDNRHPETVTFTDNVVDDLERRDFTINAIALDLNWNITDPFGGAGDISRGIIRTVGNPEKRFEEDALRILRALRFSAQLGYIIEEKTRSAIFKLKGLLNNVSKERIFEEFTKLLSADKAFEVLKEYKEVFFEILPELAPCDGFDQKSLSHSYDVYEHTLHVLKLLEDKNPVTVWAALLHDVGKPLTFVVDKKGYGHFPGHMPVSAEITEKVLNRFHVSNEFRNTVYVLVFYHDEPLSGGKYDVKKFLNKYGERVARDLITLKFADIYAHSEYGINKYLEQRVIFKRNFEEVIANNECFKLSDLQIDGFDLIELGYDGKDIGAKLDEILELVMKDELPNNRDELLRYAKL